MRRAPRHLEARGWEPDGYPHAGFPGRGAAIARFGWALTDSHEAARRFEWARNRGRGRQEIRHQAGGSARRNGRRGPRPVLRHPGAPQIHEIRARRERRHRGRGEAPGASLPANRLLPHGWRARLPLASPRRTGRRERHPPAPLPHHGPRVRRGRGAGAAGARRLFGRGFRGPGRRSTGRTPRCNTCS